LIEPATHSRTKTLNRSITYFHIGVAVFLSVGIVFVSSQFLSKTFDYFQEMIVDQQAQGVKKDIEVHLDYYRMFLEDYARFPLLIQGVMHTDDIQPVLIDFMNNIRIEGAHPQLVLLDYKNRIIHSTKKTPDFSYERDESFRQELVGTNDVYTAVSQLDGKFYWRLAVPVFYNGQREGALVAELPISTINTHGLISKDLNVFSLEILRASETCIAFGNVEPPETMDFQLPDYGLTLRFGFDSSPYQQQRNIVIAKLIILIVLCVCGGLFITLYLSRRFIEKPIQRLRDYTQLLKTGSHGEPGPAPSIQELALLADDFKLMAKNVDDREAMLREARNNLEIKVKERTKALKKSEERFELAIYGADLGLWDWNIQSGDVYLNERWATMLGYELDELEPGIATWEKLLHPDDKDNVIVTLEKHLNGETPIYQTEHRLLTKEGAWKWILDTGKVSEWDEKGKPLRASGTHLDINKLKRAEEKIRYMAHHDDLTGQPNRVLFMDRLDTAIKGARRRKTGVAVLFVDLDGFKAVNDQLGHMMGDLLLNKVAKRLKSCVRESDTVGRYGGDEFTILLLDISRKEDTDRFARKILNVVQTPYKLDSKIAHISCSIGIAIYPESAKLPEDLVMKADEAMYKVKNGGKNNYSFG